LPKVLPAGPLANRHRGNRQAILHGRLISLEPRPAFAYYSPAFLRPFARIFRFTLLYRT
jgi:hypothetical protein